MATHRLLAVLAHPDDESLGFGGTLAKYAAGGADVSLVTATRGDSGRYRGIRPGDPGHPGRTELGRLREAELRAAARTLGVGDLTLLDYDDRHLDRADRAQAVQIIAGHIRRLRPQVVVTFGPDGAYGHPDHIAICQLATAACVAAADGSTTSGDGGRDVPHAVSKLYYSAWPRAAFEAYQSMFRTLSTIVDGVERRAVPWPDWAISAEIDTRAVTEVVWRAIACHESQVTTFARLQTLSADERDALLGAQFFYRAFSMTGSGSGRERDLFEGIHS